MSGARCAYLILYPRNSPVSPEFSDFEDIAELIIKAASDPSVEGDLAELFRRNMIETA